LRVGIPEYRLPRNILENEIEDIQKCGVEIKLNSPIGEDGLAFDKLWQQGYGAIFIATGAHKSLKLGISGEDMVGVYPGTTLLREINLGKSVNIGDKVAIIGGGNVAMDAARTALRCGSKEAIIVYRRAKEQMPAYREDVGAAEEEGIKIYYFATPSRIVGRNGKVVGVECIRTELGEPDESGRRRPIPIKGSEFVVDADMVITAIGEVPDLSFLNNDTLEVTARGTIKVSNNTLYTGISGVFAGGDVVSGPATVIEAIAAGRKAALAIDRYLKRKILDSEESAPRTIAREDVDLERFNKRKRQKMAVLPQRERIQCFKEVELGFTELEGLTEADRCFQCGMFPKKDK
jgi:NADPH-dependent glutamate synthase beta subunit-like oxidoreductase